MKVAAPYWTRQPGRPVDVADRCYIRGWLIVLLILIPWVPLFAFEAIWKCQHLSPTAGGPVFVGQYVGGAPGRPEQGCSAP